MYGGVGCVSVKFEEGVVVYPKAGEEAHRKENFEAWKCPLTAEDDAKSMRLIRSPGSGIRVGR